ncbi:MAG: acyl-CoA dehydrogenase, partial [Actinobacteria bacterium]|nr:acyl-CoA dehydrogenase [Actinomycetota bacterium]
GLSFLLIDLESPGITVSPITLISGKSDFCEVFLSDVVVPADNLIGAPGQGWAIAKQLLVHERSLLGGAGGALAGGGSKRKTLVDLARETTGAADGPLPDGSLRERIAAHLMEVRALKALSQRMTDEGRRDAALPSMLKLVSTETFMARQDLTLDILGPAGLAWDGDGPAGEGEAAVVARDWLRSRANSIEGGTSEIQLNIIAKRTLGMPEAAR